VNGFKKRSSQITRFLFDPIYRKQTLKKREIKREKKRIAKLPRYVPSETTIFNKKIRFLDNCFLINYHEIFEDEIYKFHTTDDSPFIIDCGSNVGLSIIYFKMLYPNSRIIGFEADPNIYKVLSENINQFAFPNVVLIPKAVWKEDGEITFQLEGGNSSRIITNQEIEKLTIIQTSSLRPYLSEHVNFLKIDIEGAEYEVITSCRDLLGSVDHIFIEYHSFNNQKQMLGELLTILSESGFRYFIKHTGEISLYPFTHSYSNNGIDMDLQLNIFAKRF